VQSLTLISRSVGAKRGIILGVAVGLGIQPQQIGTAYVFRDDEAAQICRAYRDTPPPATTARRARRAARKAVQV